METIVIDCSGITDEPSFWRLYTETVQPEGAQYFGRNMAAFWDAISAGGPGWPGEVRLLFTNASSLASFNGGRLLRRLQEIEGESERVRVVLGVGT